MSMILVESDPSPMKLEVLGVDDWEIAERDPATFTCEYDQTETCYILAGEARITPRDGDPVRVGEGDLVTLLPGLVCTWHIRTPIRKHVRVG